MAHKKAAGSTRLGRDSVAKRLGVKIFGGAKAIAGNIIIRQHGTKYHPGLNTAMGDDYTIYAAKDGVVKFQEKKVTAFNGNKDRRMFVHITEMDNEQPNNERQTKKKS